MDFHRIASQINRYRIVSLLIHVSALIGLVALITHRTRVAAPPHQKEVAKHIILSMPGSVAAGSPKAASKEIAHRTAASNLPAPPPPPHFGRPSDTPQTGNGISGHSAWGSGEITIAYLRFSPDPKPDLSTMPKGTEGDVVLTALIDDQGKIGNLTLLAGLGPAIDQQVIQTVRSWTFTPATKDGQPISSRQELRFHFRSPHNA